MKKIFFLIVITSVWIFSANAQEMEEDIMKAREKVGLNTKMKKNLSRKKQIERLNKLSYQDWKNEFIKNVVLEGVEVSPFNNKYVEKTIPFISRFYFFPKDLLLAWEEVLKLETSPGWRLFIVQRSPSLITQISAKEIFVVLFQVIKNDPEYYIRFVAIKSLSAILFEKKEDVLFEEKKEIVNILIQSIKSFLTEKDFINEKMTNSEVKFLSASFDLLKKILMYFSADKNLFKDVMEDMDDYFDYFPFEVILEYLSFTKFGLGYEPTQQLYDKAFKKCKTKTDTKRLRFIQNFMD